MRQAVFAREWHYAKTPQSTSTRRFITLFARCLHQPKLCGYFGLFGHSKTQQPRTEPKAHDVNAGCIESAVTTLSITSDHQRRPRRQIPKHDGSTTTTTRNDMTTPTETNRLPLPLSPTQRQTATVKTTNDKTPNERTNERTAKRQTNKQTNERTNDGRSVDETAAFVVANCRRSYSAVFIRAHNACARTVSLNGITPFQSVTTSAHRPCRGRRRHFPIRDTTAVDSYMWVYTCWGSAVQFRYVYERQLTLFEGFERF